MISVTISSTISTLACPSTLLIALYNYGYVFSFIGNENQQTSCLSGNL